MFFRPISSAVCFFVLLSTTLVMAQTVTWNGSSLYEHDWRTTVNWTDLQGGALYPDNGVNVSIPGGEVDVAAGQRYRVGDLGISAAGQVSLYGTLDVDKTVTVSPRSSSQPSYVMINPGGTLNVGQNVQLGENCNIFLELDGKVNIAGNITGANNATLWLYDEFNVGKTFNVPQVNIYNDANLKVKRLAGGMDLTLRYASSGYVDNGYRVSASTK